MKRRTFLAAAGVPLAAAVVGTGRGVLPPKDVIVVENDTRRETVIGVDVSNGGGRPVTTQYFRVAGGEVERGTYRAGNMTPAAVTVESTDGARAEVDWPGDTAPPLGLRVIYRGARSDRRFDVASLGGER